MLQTEILNKLLMKVIKPGRYIGNELNVQHKDLSSISIRFAFAFPDIYEIGMSYLGLQIIYNILNKQKDVYCERVFAPASDMEALMRKERLELFTLETKTPVKQMDILGFTLQYELSYSNIINMLDLANIPLKSDERGNEDPFVIAGGPCVFNPEPLAEFIDFFLIGEAEEVLPDLCSLYGEWKQSKLNRNDFLSIITSIPGVYVPAFYKPVYNIDGTLREIEKTFAEAPDSIRKIIVDKLDDALFPDKPLVPVIETVHDRSVVEIFRGCSRGCRFCQAGMIYRPVRERSLDNITGLVRSQLASTGYDELSLLSLSTSDYSSFESLVAQLMKETKDRNVALSLPSLRLDSFSFKVLEEIQGYKKTGLTFAPEAGTQRLRNVINKCISEEDIYGSMKQAIKLGWNNIKLYFMIGLPTETFEDLDGIAEIAKNIMSIYYDYSGKKKAGRFKLTVSVSNFVPKAHTPFQWYPQDSPDVFIRKHNYLRELLNPIKGVQYNYHETGSSHIEAVLARGDRRLGDAIVRAWKYGCRFDGWREYFEYDKWIEALKDQGLDPAFYSGGQVTEGRVLPWELIDSGVSKAFLKSEWNRAVSEKTSEDCRNGCIGCGITRIFACETENENVK